MPSPRLSVLPERWRPVRYLCASRHLFQVEPPATLSQITRVTFLRRYNRVVHFREQEQYSHSSPFRASSVQVWLLGTPLGGHLELGMLPFR